MSHYTVLVIGNDVEKALAPYQENNSDDCPREFLEFISMRDDLKLEYEEWIEQHTRPGYHPLLATFDDYLAEKCQDEYNAEADDYGYWLNSNAKWDWYQIGGRWNGYFKLKDNATGIVGEPGLFSKPAPKGYVDQALKSDIDIEGMKERARVNAAAEWTEIHEIIAPHIGSFKNWEYYKKEYPNGCEARNLYHDQDLMKALHGTDKHFFGMEIEDYINPIEKFIDNAVANIIMPYAFLYKGNWVKSGNMGWFGISTDEKDEAEWQAEFNKMFNELSDDTLLTMVDCHI